MTRHPRPDEAQLHEALAALDDGDAARRTRALALLARGGTAATPLLLAALPQARGARRAAIAQLLAEGADPRAREALHGLVADPEPEVRGRGAEGLARLQDPRAPAALLLALNDLPDLLHWPFTPAVHALVALGRPMLPALAPLLAAPEPGTRARAFEVVRQVVLAEGGDEAWRGLLDTLGRFDPDTPPSAAAAPTVQAWQRWLRDAGA